jgi:hypothetical protein
MWILKDIFGYDYHAYAHALIANDIDQNVEPIRQRVVTLVFPNCRFMFLFRSVYSRFFGWYSNAPSVNIDAKELKVTSSVSTSAMAVVGTDEHQHQQPLPLNHHCQPAGEFVNTRHGKTHYVLRGPANGKLVRRLVLCECSRFFHQLVPHSPHHTHTQTSNTL